MNSSDTPILTVVCGLITMDERFLAARRGGSRRLPLLWEFPGGKVEAGESHTAALERELKEELSLRIRILRELEAVTFTDASGSIRLIPFHCVPDQEAAPVPHEHEELRWVTPEAARSLDWAPADVPLLDRLGDLLQTSGN
ncbi:MAG: (deoxy)nucleoside triphosphate pyrophosphohydrolase [Oceanipulchritudo sp.]